jgi:hypothetical protein
VSLGKKGCVFIGDHGSKPTAIKITTPEGDVTLAKYLYDKACMTSSTGVSLVMAVQSAISGNQLQGAVSAMQAPSVFFGGLDDEIDTLRKPYGSRRLGLKKAFALAGQRGQRPGSRQCVASCSRSCSGLGGRGGGEGGGGGGGRAHVSVPRARARVPARVRLSCAYIQYQYPRQRGGAPRPLRRQAG